MGFVSVVGYVWNWELIRRVNLDSAALIYWTWLTNIGRFLPFIDHKVP